jgi:hypothetical protein
MLTPQFSVSRFVLDMAIPEVVIGIIGELVPVFLIVALLSGSAVINSLSNRSKRLTFLLTSVSVVSALLTGFGILSVGRLRVAIIHLLSGF